MGWKIESYKQSGRRHKENNLLCQDQVAGQEQTGRYAISLADGVGKTNANAEAGETIVGCINRFLLENYERIQEADEQTIAGNLLLNVVNVIEEKSKELEVDKKELSSTLLGAVIDTETDTFCLVHLGDGAIAGRMEDDAIYILSEPYNGKLLNETVLSTAENALAHVKVRKGRLNDLKEIMLVSDGIYNGTSDFDKLRKCFFKGGTHDILKEMVDDQSFIKLSYE